MGKIAETASSITFPNIATTGDCMGDALRQQKKDVSKFTIDINSDGSLTFHSDGWPDLKLTKKTMTATWFSPLCSSLQHDIIMLLLRWALLFKHNTYSEVDCIRLLFFQQTYLIQRFNVLLHHRASFAYFRCLTGVT